MSSEEQENVNDICKFHPFSTFSLSLAGKWNSPDFWKWQLLGLRDRSSDMTLLELPLNSSFWIMLFILVFLKEERKLYL
jgi:hypothetical protein